MQYFQRKIYHSLVKQIDTPPVIVLTGMRRSGKTTLLRAIYQQVEGNKVFFDMDNILDQQVFDEKDYRNVWKNLEEFNIDKNKRTYIFIDEIQAVPKVIKAIKYLYDHYQVKFFVTGSSSFYLKNLFPESLAGRKIIFELFPLDFEEFLTFKQQSRKTFESFAAKDKGKGKVRYEKYIKYFEEYMKFGGFPQVVLEENIEQKKFYLKDIFSSYFQKDVQMLADFSDIKSLQQLMFLLMQRTGSKLNISKLSSELSLSRPTVYSYLSFLEGTYFISLIEPYSKNVDRAVSGAKKLYVCDNGFISEFAQVDAGNLLENAVYANLRKWGKINYFEQRGGKEIDFILPELQTAIEVKNTGTSKHLTLLEKLAKKTGMKNYYIISKQNVDQPGFIPATEL